MYAGGVGWSHNPRRGGGRPGSGEQAPMAPWQIWPGSRIRLRGVAFFAGGVKGPSRPTGRNYVHRYKPFLCRPCAVVVSRRCIAIAHYPTASWQLRIPIGSMATRMASRLLPMREWALFL
jgi:hypothetical protein